MEENIINFTMSGSEAPLPHVGVPMSPTSLSSLFTPTATQTNNSYLNLVNLDKVSGHGNYGQNGVGNQGSNGEPMMTPRSTFAALMSAVNVLNKDKPDAASVMSDMNSLASPFFSPTNTFQLAPNPWTMSIAGPPSAPKNPSANIEDLELIRNVREIANIPWENQDQLQRPPRDMKRFAQDEWYVVCRLLQWGKNPALLVRNYKKPDEDYGLYKPPTAFMDYAFQVGDRLKLGELGYSGSRNRIAVSVIVDRLPSQGSPRPFSSASAPTKPNPDTSRNDKDNTAKRKRGLKQVEAAAEAPKRVAAKKSAVANGRSSMVETNVNVDSVNNSEIQRIVSMTWPSSLGSKPPRDMKRLDPFKWYVVCKVALRGDVTALYLRRLDAPDEDKGFYKPPSQFSSYNFAIGELIQLLAVGYSTGRNKIATNIRIEKTPSWSQTNDAMPQLSKTPEIHDPQSLQGSSSASLHISADLMNKKPRLDLMDERTFTLDSPRIL